MSFVSCAYLGPRYYLQIKGNGINKIAGESKVTVEIILNYKFTAALILPLVDLQLLVRFKPAITMRSLLMLLAGRV